MCGKSIKNRFGHLKKPCYLCQRINENLSTRLAKLPVIFLLKGVSGWMQIFLLLNISVQVGLIVWALILSDQNLISHDMSEFQIKKIKIFNTWFVCDFKYFHYRYKHWVKITPTIKCLVAWLFIYQFKLKVHQNKFIASRCFYYLSQSYQLFA